MEMGLLERLLARIRPNVFSPAADYQSSKRQRQTAAQRESEQMMSWSIINKTTMHNSPYMDKKQASMLIVNPAKDLLQSPPFSTVQLLSIQTNMLVIPSRTIHLSDEDKKEDLLPLVKDSRLMIPTVSKQRPIAYRFYVGLGNNRALVARMMEQRKRWVQIQKPVVSINFKWVQCSKFLKYQMLENGIKKVYNHLEFHQEITTKNGLLKNMKRYCSIRGIKLFQLLPVSFQICLGSESQESELSSFLKFFLKNAPGKKFTREQRKFRIQDFRKMIGQHETPFSLSRRLKAPECLKPFLAEVYVSPSSSYLWLFKPIGQNRGRGIKLFNTLEELACFYLQLPQDRRNERFVVQKYMQKPMLIQGRKFDIRMWVLIDHMQQVYVFPQGYIRTSSESYKEGSKDMFVHLTNNAVQKNSSSYGRFQEGNQLSFQQFDQYCKSKIPFYSVQNLYEQAESLIVESMKSVTGLLNKNHRKYCFQILGYDFLVGSDGSVWLIEVNTNPCLEESSEMLAQLLYPMIDGAIRLTVDRIFGGLTIPEPGNRWKPLCSIARGK